MTTAVVASNHSEALDIAAQFGIDSCVTVLPNRPYLHWTVKPDRVILGPTITNSQHSLVWSWTVKHPDMEVIHHGRPELP